jgi:hypothetical protein
MRWNKRPQAPRPEFPKVVALAATAEQVRDLLPLLVEKDPEATIVDGGERGVFARVHNEEAESVARQYGESRSFPLA